MKHDAVHTGPLQYARLTLIGQLAAGIAHELRNPLAVIRMEVDELARDLQSCENNEENRRSAQERIQTIRKTVVRISSIIDQIRDVARSPTDGFRRLDLHQVLTGLMPTIRKTINSDLIQLKADLRAASPFFFGNETQLEQVFVNLISNASEAIASSKTGSSIVIRTASDDRQLTVEVEDNGPGIAPEHLPSIFDPFFTTKETGQGMGLGLAIVAQILKAHRASVEVHSASPRGTCFHISFPHDRRRI